MNDVTRRTPYKLYWILNLLLNLIASYTLMDEGFAVQALSRKILSWSLKKTTVKIVPTIT
jgi:hypothetical protein